MLLFAEERLPAIPSGGHHDEDDDGVDGDKHGDDVLHLHLMTSDHRSCRNLSSVSTLPNELEDAVFLL